MSPRKKTSGKKRVRRKSTPAPKWKHKPRTTARRRRRRPCLRCDKPILSVFPGLCKMCKRILEFKDPGEDDYIVHL